uniref:class I SAM-dependent methyltransferase n=1 Tax=uncultured Phenylobacterium sp. TaxID=349273 RepID=UPI0025EF703F
IDFRSLLAGVDPQQALGGFLVEVKLRSDHRERTLEYAVTPGWMQAVFGAPLKARPVPPADLQIRVTGAAAGEFSRAGAIAAQQIETLLAVGGGGLSAGQTVLDFGCGPGRLIGALAPRHPGVAFHGSDIDPQAIA